MMRLHVWILAGCALVAAPGLTRAAPDEAARLAERIDRRIAAAWEAAKARPAAPANDAEFLRRVYLDLAGRVPTVAEVRAFFKDPDPDKRSKLVVRLLDGPRYVTHFTNVWRALLMPEAGASLQARSLVPGFEEWLRKQLTGNVPYDRMVREILTVPVGQAAMQRIYAPYNSPGEPTPVGFYLAKEIRPENLAAGTARVFLGVRLECAQCHNHPFASWKREQFWSYAAFFSGLQRQSQGDFVAPGTEVPDRKELKIPGTERVVQASFLDGTTPAWKSKVGTRKTLADWMTRKDNPYFARAAVNRLWGYFFGTGLVEPVDDMLGDDTAGHSELLDELARGFADNGYDLKFLIRTITATRAYQLSSVVPKGAKGQEENPQRFTRSAVRGLTPEQLFDSVSTVTGFVDEQQLPPGVIVFGNNSPRAEFLTRFADRGEKSTEAQTSILQALALMNGRIVADATSVERSETLAAVIDAPFMGTAERIETLYLATLARPPMPKELTRLVRYVEEGRAAKKERAAALADVFWALLNSGEFILNH